MISRSLSSVKRSKRLSVIIISVLASMLYYVIGTIVSLTYAVENIRVNSASAQQSVIQIKSMAHSYLGLYGYGWIVTVFLAVVLAVDGYSYLNHPVAMDFYESLPIKKKSRFWMVYLQGFKIWIIPAAFNLLLAVLITLPFQALDSALLADVLLAFAGQIFLFGGVYGITVLGIMLAGRTFAGVMMTALMLVGELAIKFIIWVFATEYYTMGYFPDMFYSQMYTSPIYYYLSAAVQAPTYYLSGTGWNLTSDYIKTFAVSCFANFVICAFTAWLAKYLFGKRTRDEAGKVIVFKPMQAFLKIFVSVLAGLLICLLMRIFFGMGGSGLSLVIELLFMTVVTVLVACFMQAIMDSDIRCMFSKMWQTVFAVCLMIGIFACFKWDLTGYDTYVPKAESIRSFALYPQYGGSDTVTYYGVSGIDTSELPQEKTDSYYMNNMYLTDTEAITQLAQASVEMAEEDYENGYWTMVVYYRLKSGRNVQRLIQIPFDTDADLMNRILGSSEYKSTVYQFINSNALPEGSIAMVGYVAAGEESLPVTGGTIEGFNAAYQKDLESYDFDTVNEQDLLGQVCIDVNIPNEESENGTMSIYYSVYDSFENTIAYLENYGMEADRRLTYDQVSSIIISEGIWDDENGYTEHVETYEDEDEIREILASSVVIDLDTQWSKYDYIVDYDYDIQIQGRVQTDEEGNIVGRAREYYSYYFVTGEVPDFVIKDFE